MKTKRVLFKVTSVLLLIGMLGLTSCEPLAYLFGCATCTNNTGDSQTVCDDHEAEQLENEGWNCSGGW